MPTIPVEFTVRGFKIDKQVHPEIYRQLQRLADRCRKSPRAAVVVDSSINQPSNRQLRLDVAVSN